MEFSDFDLNPALLQAVADMGFVEPTPIQRDAIPPVLAGRDVLAAAETGSGKTAAFLLPILHNLIPRKRGSTRALVLSPTRELALQTEEQFGHFAAHTELTAATVMGGVAMGPQDQAFHDGVDLLVATPGRLLDHLENRRKRLEELEHVVLDEADRMLDMGFLPDIRKILSYIPGQRQSLLFSATLPRAIISLAADMLRDPVQINIERIATIASGISHYIYRVRDELKRELLAEMLRRGMMDHVLVFTRTKDGADRLADYLERNEISCARIHGDLSQKQRTAALQDFRDRRQAVLIATDIAARGLDVEDISHVVNFDVPETSEDYIHRVGRTGRAEQTGEAFTFVCGRDIANLRTIELDIGERIERRLLEDFDYEAEPEGAEPVDILARIAAAENRKSGGQKDEEDRPSGKGGRRRRRGGGRKGGNRGGS